MLSSPKNAEPRPVDLGQTEFADRRLVSMVRTRNFAAVGALIRFGTQIWPKSYDCSPIACGLPRRERSEFGTSPAFEQHLLTLKAQALNRRKSRRVIQTSIPMYHRALRQSGQPKANNGRADPRTAVPSSASCA